MDAKSRPPIQEPTEGTARATTEPTLRDGWHVRDRRFLVELNATAIPRAAICALGSFLPIWRGESDARVVAGRLAEHRVKPSHAKVAIDLYGSRTASPLQEKGSTRPDEQTRNTVAGRASTSHDSTGPDALTIVTCADREYPERLRTLPLPPPVLFCRGPIPRQPAISIVGSRRADRYGLEVAETFGRHLAECGLAIVSGFAKGIDQAAHRGALQAPHGTTVAVLGCSLDTDYPSGSAGLANEIAHTGAVLSEFPPGTGPQRHNFPIRNRLIAALSLGTLVVQATQRSGSLITARLALELGRDVFAVPGRITDALSSGTNRLIQDGALPALRPEDIIDALPTAVQLELSVHETNGRTTRPTTDRPPPPAHLDSTLRQIPDEATSIEALAGRTRTPIDQLFAQLLELEIGGWIDHLPGSMVRRKNVKAR